MVKKIIGWCYDKHGNAVEVHAPVNDKLQTIIPDTKTITGQIPDGVGCATNKWDIHKAIGMPARPTLAFGQQRGQRLFLPCYAVKTY